MGTELVVVGGGNMGAALVGGLLATSWAAPDSIAVVEPVAARRDELTDRFPGVAVVAELAGGAEGAVLAVKPVDVAAGGAVVAAAGATRLVSIVAGVTTGRLEELVGPGCAVVRAMPNVAALVGAGASAIAPGRGADEDVVAWAASVLRAVGTVVEVPEALLDAVTGLSGSGPGYVFLVAEALVDGGVTAGLPRPTAVALVEQLLVGSAKLLAESGQSAAELRGQVTSPGGTTAAGLRALEQAGVRAAFIDSVLAATERSRELGS